MESLSSVHGCFACPLRTERFSRRIFRRRRCFRRGDLLQHLDDRLPGGSHRSFLSRPDRGQRPIRSSATMVSTSLDVESGSPRCAGSSSRNSVRSPATGVSNESLGDYLSRNGIPGIQGIDTRALTKRLRTAGAMRACIAVGLSEAEAIQRAKDVPYEGVDFVRKSPPEKPLRVGWRGKAEPQMDSGQQQADPSRPVIVMRWATSSKTSARCLHRRRLRFRPEGEHPSLACARMAWTSRSFLPAHRRRMSWRHESGWRFSFQWSWRSGRPRVRPQRPVGNPRQKTALRHLPRTSDPRPRRRRQDLQDRNSAIAVPTSPSRTCARRRSPSPRRTTVTPSIRLLLAIQRRGDPPQPQRRHRRRPAPQANYPPSASSTIRGFSGTERRRLYFFAEFAKEIEALRRKVLKRAIMPQLQIFLSEENRALQELGDEKAHHRSSGRQHSPDRKTPRYPATTLRSFSKADSTISRPRFHQWHLRQRRGSPWPSFVTADEVRFGNVETVFFRRCRRVHFPASS